MCNKTDVAGLNVRPGAPGQEGTMLFSRIQTGGWPDNGLYVCEGRGGKIVSG